MTPTKEHIAKIVAMMGARMFNESPYLTPQPTILMTSPYEILDFIRGSELLTEEQIDKALVEGQSK